MTRKNFCKLLQEAIDEEYEAREKYFDLHLQTFHPDFNLEEQKHIDAMTSIITSDEKKHHRYLIQLYKSHCVGKK